MKHLLHILLLCCFCCHAWAQGTTKCFKAYDGKGQEAKILCVGQEYLFQDCGDQVPDENEYYVFDYKNGTPIANASDAQNHTYTSPGLYRVLQIANYGNNTLTDTVSVVFEVKESPAPAFSIQNCAGGTVTITVTDSNYSSYSLDFGDGTTSTNVRAGSQLQHRYTAPGTYSLTLTGAYAGAACAGMRTAEVTVLPSVPAPKISRLTVLEQAASGQLQLDLENLQPGFGYLVQQSQNGSYRTIDTIRSVTQSSLTRQITGVNTATALNYRIVPYDACASALPNSNVVSSVAIQSSATADERVEIAWQSMLATGTFELYRNGTLLQTLPQTATKYTDTDVRCGQAYRYEVRALASDGSVSQSVVQEVQVLSSAIPAPPTLFSTYTISNQVEVLVQLPEGEDGPTVYLERSVAGGIFKALAQGQQTQFTDSDPLAATCYRATYTNACGNTSPLSAISCPIFLRAKQQPDGAAVFLEWSAYTGFPTGMVSYTVEVLDEAGNSISSYPASGETYTDRSLQDELQRLRYRIKGSLSDGSVTYSNVVEVEQELQLYVPSGFTPNGDGLNDTFEVKGRFFSDYTIRIYNGSGRVVYEGTASEPAWDGTYNGKLLPTGAYAYEINAVSKSGAAKRRTGTVTLLR
ncbi:gliding motility-associated C-terminal domain-containing protein [Pontibacter sp. E15-1]|uniref:T9SS type B sorting domain-containing protein n=1 Tax=Pontibacter sp. E15-1 TaxID=2919918 RepID=UPI001F4FB11E|nr:gliding motility-associated C-terminal domain-containing protein [Pontibacter sp. E15-1]MCJ8166392.1 gliding motility-associated C-terminal domain-containing protein [Pontibacter sp. E15-1]